MRNNPDVPVYLMAQVNTAVRFEKNLRRRHPKVMLSEPLVMNDPDFHRGRKMTTDMIHTEMVDRMEVMLHRLGIEQVTRGNTQENT